ncbi:VOC family protein [Agrococcus citreus]|uniref:VOC domain-containing protein n=1 Tax=Agrococcus citreus TaxID=84643 RepID=A0ABN1YRR8_9MICO
MVAIWRGAAVPILPVADLDRSVAFYRGIGFDVEVSAAGRYAFVRSEGVQLHVSETGGFDPFSQAGMAYVFVDDVEAVRAALDLDDALALSHAELRSRWARGESLARATPMQDEPWGVREFSFMDPDNNLIRVGGPPPHH